jgi:hypothetical protein
MLRSTPLFHIAHFPISDSRAYQTGSGPSQRVSQDYLTRFNNQPGCLLAEGCYWKFEESPAPEQSADHAAYHANGTATAVTVNTMARGRIIVIGFIGVACIRS